MDFDPRFGDYDSEVGPMEELEEVSIDENDPTRGVKVGKKLKLEVKPQLVEFLRRNQDVFAWSHEDMLGIDPSIIVHHLNIDPSFKQVKQK